MKKIFIAILFMAATGVSCQSTSKNNGSLWSSGRPDSHAPISVMGDHIHSKGEWMFSYRFMFMNMEDLHKGSHNVETGDALQSYMVTPVKMPMNMHMLGAMYAPTNRITLMVMAPYTQMSMDHITRMGTSFTTKANGFGDIKVAGLYKLLSANRQLLHGQIGLSIPTGSIDRKDVTPASAPAEVILPYPMQTGSGTWDIETGLTYLKQWDFFSYGAQLKGTFRTGKNDNGYHLGNHYYLNNWVAVKASSSISFSGRFGFGIDEKISGKNQALNPMMVVTADTRNSGKTYADLGLGVNWKLYKGIRLAIEGSIPLFQNVNGIQLKQKETLVTGLQYSL